ncbi:hypothetical protein CERSUDRAFT_40464, partial [Gelatoporia subvermispora B]
FVKNRLYQHKKLLINYTSYNMRHNRDSINSRTHSDVMLLSYEDESKNGHLYWYTRVAGIFHVDLCHQIEPDKWSDEQHMDVLLVWWYGRNLRHPGGFIKKCLLCMRFLDASDPGAFGFLDPALVIREAHVIPAFAFG